MQRAHSDCQHSFCASAPASVCPLSLGCLLRCFARRPFHLHLLSKAFLCHRCSSIGLLLLLPPPYFCLQDLACACRSDLSQSFHCVSRPTFPLMAPTSLQKGGLSASSCFSCLPSGPLFLVLLCPTCLPYYLRPLLSIKPSDLPAHACLCLFHRLTPYQQMCLQHLWVEVHRLCTL